MSERYTTKKLKSFCKEKTIPKEFESTEHISDIEDELKAFTLGCELFKKQVGYRYNGENLENIQEIKEAGVY